MREMTESTKKLIVERARAFARAYASAAKLDGDASIASQLKDTIADLAAYQEGLHGVILRLRDMAKEVDQ